MSNMSYSLEIKKILLALFMTFGLNTIAVAANPATEGTYIAPDASTLDFSGDYDFAIGAAVDYGPGLSMQFKKMIDLSIGIDGVGADFIFFRYDFMPNSRFFSKKPLNFYVGGGLGYVWEEANNGRNNHGLGVPNKGLVLRTPIGADWRFHKKWAVYLSASPLINFGEDTDANNNNGDVKFKVMGTVGIRYLF